MDIERSGQIKLLCRFGQLTNKASRGKPSRELRNDMCTPENMYIYRRVFRVDASASWSPATWSVRK